MLEACFFGADELPDDIALPDHIRPALAAWAKRLDEKIEEHA